MIFGAGPRQNRTRWLGALLQIIFIRARNSHLTDLNSSEMTSAFNFAAAWNRTAVRTTAKIWSEKQFCDVMHNVILQFIASWCVGFKWLHSVSPTAKCLVECWWVHYMPYISLIQNRFVRRRNKWLGPSLWNNATTRRELILHAIQVSCSPHNLFSANCVNGECEQIQQNDAIKSGKRYAKRGKQCILWSFNLIYYDSAVAEIWKGCIWPLTA